jgi:hypothetical protein
MAKLALSCGAKPLSWDDGLGTLTTSQTHPDFRRTQGSRDDISPRKAGCADSLQRWFEKYLLQRRVHCSKGENKLMSTFLNNAGLCNHASSKSNIRHQRQIEIAQNWHGDVHGHVGLGWAIILNSP